MNCGFALYDGSVNEEKTCFRDLDVVNILLAVKLDELTAVFEREIVAIDMIDTDTLIFVFGKVDIFYFHACSSAG
jgi:hypothetical protein